MLIQNYNELVSHGNIEARRTVLDILETGLGAADPYINVKKIVRIEGHKLLVGTDELPPNELYVNSRAANYRPAPKPPLVFDLNEVKNIYVVGGGKAAQRQAQALEEILGDRITDGQINAKKGDEVVLKRIPVTLAGHPIPDEDSVIGSQRIYELERKAQKGDIVFLSESGGGSALMCLPAPGITLEDMQEVYRLLYFGCGVSMPVANAVRNMLAVVRGRHARHCGEATMIHIATPELPPAVHHGDDRRPEQDHYEYAIEVLKRNNIWDKVSPGVREFLLRADPEYAPLRPEEWFENPRYAFRVTGPEIMLEAARRKAQELGLQAKILVSSLNDLEARPVGDTMAYIAQEIESRGEPLAAPCVLLLGGELTVAVGDADGFGGRNQEFVLGAAQRIAGSQRILIASADSDGCDGPTQYAGALVDGQTAARAAAVGIDIAAALRRHDACTALHALGDTIYTGVLKTNVRDLRVIYVGA